MEYTVNILNKWNNNNQNDSELNMHCKAFIIINKKCSNDNFHIYL